MWQSTELSVKRPFRIEYLNEEAKKKRDQARIAKGKDETEKIRLKLWKYSYMIKKDQPKLREALGLSENCTYEDLFEAMEVDIEGKERDILERIQPSHKS